MKASNKSENLWQCRNCDRPFANKNQSHSCGRYSVADFLDGKSERAVALYNRFFDLVQSCGPVRVAPARTRIGFQVRMIFAAVNRLTDTGLDAHVILARRLKHPRFGRIDGLSPRSYVHHFRIKSMEEIDEEVREWLNEAYRVGSQEHLQRRV